MIDREKLKAKLQDLLKQATEERSHFYVGSVIREVLASLSSRDSTPTEGVGKRVVEESMKSTGMNLSWDVREDLSVRIDRALTAPRMTLDLRGVATTAFNYDRKAMIDAIRKQLPNVEVITE